MTHESPPGLLVLHAVRILGYADTPAIAARFGLDATETAETLLDAQAYGWVQRTAFADLGGWSLTRSGRAENERQLAAELTGIGGTEEVHRIHTEFLPLNARLQQACTNWQLRPTATDRLAANDHSDPAWDTTVLGELAGIGQALAPLATRLGELLARFDGYQARFDAARRRALAGDGGWIDRTDVDSCHRVWFELHEDLIATLSLSRG